MNDDIYFWEFGNIWFCNGDSMFAECGLRTDGHYWLNNLDLKRRCMVLP